MNRGVLGKNSRIRLHQTTSLKAPTGHISIHRRELEWIEIKSGERWACTREISRDLAGSSILKASLTCLWSSKHLQGMLNVRDTMITGVRGLDTHNLKLLTQRGAIGWVKEDDMEGGDVDPRGVIA